MTFNYAALATTAKNLIANFGQAATYTQTTAGAYNTATGKVTNTPVNTSVKAVLLDYNKSLTNNPGSLIKDGDRKVLIAGTSLASAPGTTDTVTIAGETFVVVSAPVVLNPGGTVLLYELHVRK
jgi:hypothetical protein